MRIMGPGSGDPAPVKDTARGEGSGDEAYTSVNFGCNFMHTSCSYYSTVAGGDRCVAGQGF